MFQPAQGTARKHLNYGILGADDIPHHNPSPRLD